ncbi:hypothetical protein PJ267_06430 [Arthrobacter sp. OVS8]|nr:hypothetical protein PJ267_06430 [Arthrobacter sp. OVS8]
MLESELRLVVDQAPGHHEVAGNPLGAVVLEGLDLVLCGAVQFLARNVVVDLRRTLAVGAVGAAQVPGIGDADRAVFCLVAAKLARARVAAVKAAGRTVITAAERLPVVSAAVRLAVTVAAEGAVLSPPSRGPRSPYGLRSPPPL